MLPPEPHFASILLENTPISIMKGNLRLKAQLSTIKIDFSEINKLLPQNQPFTFCT